MGPFDSTADEGPRERRMTARRRVPGRVFAPLVALLLALSSCAHTAELQREVETLRAEVEELRRADRSLALRFDELEGRVRVMGDRMEARRSVLYPADEPPPALPVVRLSATPPETPAASAPTTGWTEPFAYQTLDSSGRIVTAGGATAPSAAAVPPPVAPRALAAPSAAPLAMAPRPADPAADAKVQRAYRQAMDALKRGQAPKAMALFEKLVRTHPTHDLADNALYWIGECHYAEQRYLEALQAFQRVIRDYPQGNKVADSMVKTGLCYQNLGELAQARRVLQQVGEMFPDSAAARVAQARVRELR